MKIIGSEGNKDSTSNWNRAVGPNVQLEVCLSLGVQENFGNVATQRCRILRIESQRLPDFNRRQ